MINIIIHCNRAVDEIRVDGVLDEKTWLEAEVADNFWMMLPMDTSRANARTEVRVSYDDKNFYIIAVCYDTLPGGYVVESMKRDFNFGGNDNFLVFIDPFDDKTNGFSFGANAAGASGMACRLMAETVNLNWDNKWTSAVKIMMINGSGRRVYLLKHCATKKISGPGGSISAGLT
jgi:hypothetical protein